MERAAREVEVQNGRCGARSATLVGAAAGGARRGPLRPRQREQPPQRPEPVRGGGAPAWRARHPAHRPPDRRGGSSRHPHRPPPLRHRDARWRDGCRAQSQWLHDGAGDGRPADRALRCQHGRWCGPGGRGRATRIAVAAVVSRGGRPDLAGVALPRVRTPTLLIVGGDDTAGDRNEPRRHGADERVRWSWRSSPARRTSSRSRGHWRGWRSWLATGSCGTSRPRADRSAGGAAVRSRLPAGPRAGVCAAVTSQMLSARSILARRSGSVTVSARASG
jgi:hypothetical protein